MPVRFTASACAQRAGRPTAQCESQELSDSRTSHTRST